MTKRELKTKTGDLKNETASALLELINSITNKGQKKKLLAKENVIRLLSRYGVEISEE